MTETATGTAWYVFGVADARSLGDDVATIVEGELAAIVAEVSMADFDEDVLPERLNDRLWLEERVRAHDDLLKATAARAPVVPFRFGTVYRDADDVRGMLRERRLQLASTLERVQGRFELGVKAWLTAEASADPAGAPATGRAYLEQRLGAQRAARDRSATLAERALALHERLLAHAVDGRMNRPQSRELTGSDQPMILNGAYLVEDADAFRTEVERAASESAGVAVELTGPWPPYNFVDDDEEDA